MIAKLTASGCGIGILPSRVAASYGDKLTQISATPLFQDEICLLIREENGRVKAIQTCVNAIQNFFTKGSV